MAQFVAEDALDSRALSRGTWCMLGRWSQTLWKAVLAWVLSFLTQSGDHWEASLKGKRLQICPLVNTLCPALFPQVISLWEAVDTVICWYQERRKRKLLCPLCLGRHLQAELSAGVPHNEESPAHSLCKVNGASWNNGCFSYTPWFCMGGFIWRSALPLNMPLSPRLMTFWGVGISNSKSPRIFHPRSWSWARYTLTNIPSNLGA